MTQCPTAATLSALTEVQSESVKAQGFRIFHIFFAVLLCDSTYLFSEFQSIND